MARARSIKPGFYKNEDLAECSVWARLLFPGLWMLADREGRIEDRPKRIKGELFPYDSIEVDPLLKELEQWGFIDRYVIDSKKVISILNFNEHQAPHGAEKDSEFPDKNGIYTIHERNEKNGCVTGVTRFFKPDSDINTVQAQCKDDANTVATHPSSLNPSSLNPGDGEKKQTAVAVSPRAEKPRPQPKTKLRHDTAMLENNGIDLQCAKDFLAIRKTVFTQTALDGLVREAGKAGISPSDAVRICVERGWQSFNSTWDWNPEKKQIAKQNAGWNGSVSFREALESSNF